MGWRCTTPYVVPHNLSYVQTYGRLPVRPPPNHQGHFRYPRMGSLPLPAYCGIHNIVIPSGHGRVCPCIHSRRGEYLSSGCSRPSLQSGQSWGLPSGFIQQSRHVRTFFPCACAACVPDAHADCSRPPSPSDFRLRHSASHAFAVATVTFCMLPASGFSPIYSVAGSCAAPLVSYATSRMTSYV